MELNLKPEGRTRGLTLNFWAGKSISFIDVKS